MAGQIIQPAPSLVNPSTVVAEKVANLAVPATATTVWDKLQNKQELAITPPMSGGMSTSFNNTPGTTKLQSLSTRLADNSRYKLDLPNLEGRPKQGIATAMQEVDGGRGSGAQKGNTVYVDDKNFPVTLKEIIGSRMLTAEQLQKASIQNVKKLFRVGLNSTNHKGSASVGTAEENEELYYMAQRMMIEGFIRGVDITKELEKQGGLNIAIRNVSFNANPTRNLGLNVSGPGMDSINFNAKFWRGASEAEKYTLFLHELGHGLLNRPELGSELKYDIMGDGPRGVAKRMMSSKEMYNKILNDHFADATNKGTIAIAKLEAGKGTSNFDPSWFPQLSGEQVATVQGGSYDPNASGGNSSPDYSGLMNDNFAKLSSMLQAQQAAQMASMQDFQQQQEMMNIMNNMPAPQATNTIDSSSSGPSMAAQASSALIQGVGGIDTTGFAQQIANLESGSTTSAGNLLASG